MRILCTNDDGYMAGGLKVLAEAAKTLGDVEIVAPDREQSATSHALTIHRPLRSRTSADGTFIVDGTPTDCVIMAVNELLTSRPDFCLSGVNHGANMGEDVLYSGTVAAAMEATVIGIPSVALSYTGDDYESLYAWVALLEGFLKQILARKGFPKHTLLNVNLPPVPPTEVGGVKVTSLGRRRYADSITKALDPKGREYYWIGGDISTWAGAEDADYRAVAEGFISVTPLHLDLTNYKLLEEIRGWDLAL
ncbi:MAG: 5'/3'-nucleotidase SurE [Gemmatimonadetes bacterium]|nr:5'/3'-nucleotidase SurE [Gemmatimonadota bacterium]NNM05164.1 5'/3'-nucleotidase SurE [Gemmatimonadota bacterium]